MMHLNFDVCLFFYFNVFLFFFKCKGLSFIIVLGLHFYLYIKSRQFLVKMQLFNFNSKGIMF